MRSRKAPGDGLCLQPPLQALRPRLPHLLGHIDDEPARPSHCLTDNVREPLLAAAAWICQTDLASWLVPEAGADMHTGDTFKSGGLYLSLLECTPICLPTPCSSAEGFICVHVGTVPAEVTARFDAKPDLLYPDSETLLAIEQGLTVDYLESFDRSCCYFLSTRGLPAPHPEAIPQDRQSCVSGHSAVQLAGDLIRLAAHHWGQGIRSCLILPSAVESAHLPSLRVPQWHVTICISDTGGYCSPRFT